MDYKKLRTIDVSPFIEQKGKLNYISWANGVDQLLQADPMATWLFHDVIYYAETAMVGVTLNTFGKHMEITEEIASTIQEFIKRMKEQKAPLYKPDSHTLKIRPKPTTKPVLR